MRKQSPDIKKIKGKVDRQTAKTELEYLSGEFSPLTADYVTYVTLPGDTLSQIARRFGTTVAALAELNQISDPDQIYVMDTIRIPEKNYT